MPVLHDAARAFNLDQADLGPGPETALDRRLRELRDETFEEYEPSQEDLEWIACVNVDSFLPAGLLFGNWLEEQARQHRLRADECPPYSYGEWHGWLAAKIDELRQVAAWLGAAGPAEFDDRRDTCDELTHAKSYDAGYQDGKGGR